MKLYVYNFSDGKLNCAEVEVEEKPKTYKVPHGTVPFCYLNVLKKKDEGKFVDYFGRTVFYTEPSKEKAIEKFKKELNRKLEEKRKEVAILENNLEYLESEE